MILLLLFGLGFSLLLGETLNNSLQPKSLARPKEDYQLAVARVTSKMPRIKLSLRFRLWRWLKQRKKPTHEIQQQMLDGMRHYRRLCGHLDLAPRYCDECRRELRGHARPIYKIVHQSGCGDYHPCDCQASIVIMERSE